MPLYEFRCESCGHSFEELIFKQAEIQELVCPSCGAPRVTQMMSTFASASARAPAGAATSGGGCGPGSFS